MLFFERVLQYIAVKLHDAGGRIVVRSYDEKKGKLDMHVASEHGHEAHKRTESSQEGDEQPCSPYATQDALRIKMSNPSSSSHGSGSGFSRAHHFNPEHDVVLHIECLSSTKIKRMLCAKVLTRVVSTTILVILVVLQAKKLVSAVSLSITEVAAVGLCLVVLLVALGRFIISCVWVRRNERYWSKRRARLAALAVLHTGLQALNGAFYVASAGATLHNCSTGSSFCGWSEFIQWTLWNCELLLTLVETHCGCTWVDKHGKYRQKLLFAGSKHKGGDKRATLVLDAPWTVHIPKLFWWCILQAANAMRLACMLGAETVVAGAARGERPSFVRPHAIRQGSCHDIPANTLCRKPGLCISSFILALAALPLYFIPHARLVAQGKAALKSEPYNAFRLGRVLMRIFLSEDLGTGKLGMLIVGLVLSKVFESPACSQCLQTFILVATHIQTTLLLVQNLYMFKPIVANPEDPLVLQIWLQAFAWVEQSRSDVARQRIENAPAAQRRLLEAEPIFCVETAIKAHYWCALAYEVDEGRAVTQLSQDTAMSLYGLQKLQLVREEAVSDTKVLLAWSADMLVISFRGTASSTNALADLQAWLTPLETGQGCTMASAVPAVHRGFYKSWRSSALADRVTQVIRQQVCPDAATASTMRVLLTGHSLGGALAMLAAYDLSQLYEQGWKSLEVVTLGAPRPGNAGFAKEYDLRVPNTWHVINYKDPVPHIGKFGYTFKRPGQRVLIDQQGEMIVRPSPLDIRLETLRKCGSVRQHYLLAYRTSMIAVIKSQLKHEKFDDGLAGILELAESPAMQELLLAADLDVRKELDSLPGPARALAAAESLTSR